MTTFDTTASFTVQGQRFRVFEVADGSHRVSSEGPKLLTRKYVSEHFGADYDTFAATAAATYATAEEAEAAIRSALQ